MLDTGLGIEDWEVINTRTCPGESPRSTYGSLTVSPVSSHYKEDRRQRAGAPRMSRGTEVGETRSQGREKRCVGGYSGPRLWKTPWVELRNWTLTLRTTGIY